MTRRALRRGGWLPALLALMCGSASLAAGNGASIMMVCAADNDLFRAMTASGMKPLRCDSPADALQRATKGAAVLILADGYPKTTTDLPSGLLDTARAKDLRLFVEYPTALSGLEFGKPQGTHWERAVVSSDFFGADLAKLRILAIHDCHYLPVEAKQPHIVVARVAGFDIAVYGLPDKVQPILFEHADGRVLVATTKLSQFITARYAPSEAWRTIWQAVLDWLCPGKKLPPLCWTPTVRPSFGADESLPDDVERLALSRGVAWFKKARLLVHPTWADQIDARQKGYHDGVAPMPPKDWPIGNGRDGVLEGFSSKIYHDGTQPMRWYLRNDCTGEVAMGFAFGGRVLGQQDYRGYAANLNDFIYTHSVFAKGPRGNPNSPTYGLLSWSSNPPADGIYYGDDNARSILGTMACASLLDSTKWNEGMLRCILANFRTCGIYGFRGGRLDENGLQKHGWRHFFGRNIVNYAPHYEAYIWACYLWAYHHTGYKPLLERAKTAIRMTMAAYPDQWRWTNGIQQERARMLLPLAWLVRTEDTSEHRAWLDKMVRELLKYQADCGAIREQLGGPGKGSYGPPRSNEDYGKHEATLMQANGDPLCDLLYTTNFAFIGLHEAACATGRDDYKQAVDKLARFLCRIQVRSEVHTELDGAWYRAFDFDRWEYWASNADAGWGAWSVETGWTQGWITAVLAMRRMKTSLWEVTADTKIKRLMPQLRNEMIPDDALPKPAKPVEHDGRGKRATLATPPAANYPGGGPAGLTDGRRGKADHTDPAWLGFEGPDLVATIDLGKISRVRTIRAGFLQSTRVGIYMPRKMTVAVSSDGKHFTEVGSATNPLSDATEGPVVKDLVVKLNGASCRYVRVIAKSIGTIPKPHRAAGRKAWLFVDEVLLDLE